MSQNAVDIYNQGYFYYTGTQGYPLNKRMALTCFQQAADLGFSDAMNYLGLIYEEGTIVPKDIKKAIVWFYKALEADNKNVHACYNIARMYFDGCGVPQDIDKAFKYYKAAATMNEEKPHPESCYMVGCIYMEVDKNYTEAYKYFMKAARYISVSNLWLNLGYLAYEQGIVPVNNKYGRSRKGAILLAKEYYAKAISVDGGNVQALYNMGLLCCQNGWGQEGCEWLQMAIALGHEPSKKFYKMYRFGQML